MLPVKPHLLHQLALRVPGAVVEVDSQAMNKVGDLGLGAEQSARVRKGRVKLWEK
jgi:hypothetical protein